MKPHFVFKSRFFFKNDLFFVQKIFFSEHIFLHEIGQRVGCWPDTVGIIKYIPTQMFTPVKKININACCLLRSIFFITKIVHVRLFTMKSIFKRKKDVHLTHPRPFIFFCIICETIHRTMMLRLLNFDRPVEEKCSKCNCDIIIGAGSS